MAEVIWAEPALDDLHQIYEYIRRDSPRYAHVMIERIVRATNRLARFPDSGSVLPELPKSAYRQLFVGVYRVVFRSDESASRVLIMTVIHGNRDFPNSFDAP